MSLPDVIDLPPDKSSSRTRLVYFFPGNPGLIAYYIDFLDHLRHLINADNDQNYHIYGKSLPGFQIHSQAVDMTDMGPHDLAQTITTAKASVLQTSSDLLATYNSNTSKAQAVEVILIGHSIGAYIALEILNQLKLDHENHQIKITATIGLFPTIVDIAASPSGRKLTPLLTLPTLPACVSLVAKTLTTLLPTPLLQNLVSLITHFPPPAAATTTAFLQSPTGVRQALHLAADEMRRVRHDVWGAEVWGFSSLSSSVNKTQGKEIVAEEAAEVVAKSGYETQLFFYWGEEDHWVSARTRDGVIAARAREGRGPVMKVDKGGVPHSFCIRDSGVVAREVGEWVRGLK